MAAVSPRSIRSPTDAIGNLVKEQFEYLIRGRAGCDAHLPANNGDTHDAKCSRLNGGRRRPASTFAEWQGLCSWCYSDWLHEHGLIDADEATIRAVLDGEDQ